MRRWWVLLTMSAKRIVIVTLVTLAFTTMYFGVISVRLYNEPTLQQSVTLMQARLKFLESQYIRQEQLLNQAKGNEVQHVNIFTPEVEDLLRNISGSRTDEAVRKNVTTQVSVALPLKRSQMRNYYTANVSEITTGFFLGTNRRLVQTIIGIPTVSRPKQSYLETTVKHLLDGLTIEQKKNTLIVIYIGETDLEFIIRRAYGIEKAFPKELSSGLIEIISPGENYYPDFNTIPLSLGDSRKRVNWRTKQNLDAIFLMSFAQPRCLYYLMVEDDVIAEKQYMTEIDKYTASMTISKPDWFFIQYSTTGGIGKLFRSSDLYHFTAYVQLFYTNMPIDWLLESYLADRACGINKTSKQCGDAKSEIRPTFNKNLFKHIGVYSSLKGKIQTVKGGQSATTQIDFVPHENPPVKNLTSTVTEEAEHTVEFAYEGSTFAWVHKAQPGDVIEFWFKNPITMGSYKIYTASAHHQKDRLYNAVFEAKPEKDYDFLEVSKPDEFGILEGEMPREMNPVVAVRIRFLESSLYWLLITEIEFEDKGG